MADTHGTSGERPAGNDVAAAHAPVSHEPDAAHGHGEAAGGEAALGPIDWAAWMAGALGVVAGLAVVFALFLAGRGVG